SYKLVEALSRFDEARQVYIEMLHSASDDANLWENAGSTFSLARLPNEVLQAYQAAARLNLSAGHAEEALQACEAAMRLAPDRADLAILWFIRAEALVQAGRREGAIQAYHQSLHFEPGRLEVEARLKVVLAELGQHEQPAPEKDHGDG